MPSFSLPTKVLLNPFLGIFFDSHQSNAQGELLLKKTKDINKYDKIIKRKEKSSQYWKKQSDYLVKNHPSCNFVNIITKENLIWVWEIEYINIITIHKIL